MKKYILIWCFCFLTSIGVLAQKLVRGPYLQLATSSSMCVKIHLNAKYKAQLRYGENVAELTNTIKSDKDSIAHDFKIKNLTPLTKYYYKIYLSDTLLFGDSTTFFLTNPAENTSPSMRFIVLGDCGSGNAAQAEVLTAAQEYLKNKQINGMLLLGDNAYNNGLLDDYQRNFFDIFDKKGLHNTALWPCPGNHEYADKRPLLAALDQRPAYYQLFDTPTLGQAGGLPSGDEAYYTFNMANVHFISLDSFGYQDGRGLADTLSRQYKWLEADLAQKKELWTVVFFHHPPYSMGSHNSDKEAELVKLREVLVPLLDKFKVDVVLTGHSHNYERSFLMQGHYGLEASFDSSKHAVSLSSARLNGSINSCPFVNKNQGTVYNVSGAASRWGAISSGAYPHNAMLYSNSEVPGASIIAVDSNRLELKYINVKGEVLDNYIMYKNVNKTQNYTADCGDEIVLKPSFKADYSFPAGIVVNTNLKIDSLYKNFEFTFTDVQKCMKDSVKVTVKPYPSPKANISNVSVIEGETVQFKAEGKGQLVWERPDKIRISNNNFSLDAVSLKDTGVYRLFSTYKKCYSSDSVSLKVIKRILATEPIASESLVFPNPGNGYITIDLDIPSSDNLNYTIYNSNGLVVKKGSFLKEKKQVVLEIKELQSGQYTIQFLLNGSLKTHKFIKN